MTTVPTRLTILTPAGRGAIATVAVRGPRAVELVGRRFQPASRRPLADQASQRVIYGRWKGSGVVSGPSATLVENLRPETTPDHSLAGGEEELVVVVIGPEEVDVYCHGGPAAVEAIAAALQAEGAVRTSWQDLAVGEAGDPIQAEARVALAAAATTRTCAILLDQFRGALAREFGQIEALLTEAQLDEAGRRLGRLSALAPLGLHLTQPWKVVLAGPPNVGKSSLINALLGYQRSIVLDQPGTTRDVLSATTAIDGWPVELSDTAGLRPAGDSLEAAGIERAREQLAQADCVLAIADAAAKDECGVWRLEVNTKHETRSASAGPLLVGNKCDLLLPHERDQWQAQWAGAVLVSAKTGEGMGSLCAAIARRLVGDPPAPGAAVPFLPRHVERIGELSRRLAAAGNRP